MRDAVTLEDLHVVAGFKTERLADRAGKRNLSFARQPMHLRGYYYVLLVIRL